MPMNYFVNENVFSLNSGTEFSSVKRLQLFKEHGLPAKILTRNYNPQLSADLARVGLSHADVLNMYDFFQGLENAPAKDENVRYTEAIDKRKYHIEGIDANESLIKHAGKVIGKVSIAPATIGIVGMIDYFDDMAHVVARDIWDRRGFKSSTQYFHPDGRLGSQIFFDLTGKVKLEMTHMNIQGNLNPTMYKLLDYKNRTWRFNSEMELFSFFLNEIALNDKVVFINDRPSLLPAVASVQNAAGKWEYLHNSHSENSLQVGASRKVADYLRPLFEGFKDHMDGVIVATDLQKQEIQKFYHFKNVVALPDTFADETVLNGKNRQPLVIYLGRIAAEKNPIDALEVIKLVKTVIPDAKLDFYGYASPAELQNQMNQKVKELGLESTVTFRGYQSPEVIGKALDEAKVLVNFSSGEGFGMNILEGLSHGVPAVAYRVKYGLADMIEDGKTGRLITYGAIREAAQAVADVLVSDLSEAAFEKAQEFSKDKVFAKWEAAQKALDCPIYVGGNE